jgi:hypothetical protein
MTTAPTISRQRPANPALDFAALRAEGLRQLEALTGAVWTDFNLHDPGITLLEVLCYALTDLGYRTAFPLEDLLASGGGSDFAPFGDALTMLPSRPVTARDYRKLLLDLPGVRNAWVRKSEAARLFADLLEEKLKPVQPEHSRFKTLLVNGLYEFLLDLDGTVPEPDVLLAAQNVYRAHRNLGEDVAAVRVVPPQAVVLCADLDLTPDADPARVLAEARLTLDDHLAPVLPRYSLAELLQKSKPDGSRRTVDDILDGTPPQAPDGAYTGLFDDDELDAADLPDAIYASDLIRRLMAIEGVVGVRHLQLNDGDDPNAPDAGQDWVLPLKEGHHPTWKRLTPTGQDLRYLHFFKDGIPVQPDLTRAGEIETQLKTARDARKRTFSRADLQPQPPVGRVRDLTGYVPVAHDLPLVYGVGPAGLPEKATPERQAQARQLRAYLAVFDQLLANYLSQLRNVHALFSAEEALGRTYFTQVVATEPALWKDVGQLPQFLDDLAEKANSEEVKQRRTRLLDHLLARVAESFNDYVLHRFAAEGEKDVAGTLAEKAVFLQEYPLLSRDRMGAADYLAAEAVVSGAERRLARLLGLTDEEKPLLIEHHLLRPDPAWTGLPPLPDGGSALLPLCTDDACGDDCVGGLDPYSFRLTVALPAEAPRFRREDARQQLAFRQYAERVIRLELPAHLLPKVCWVDGATLDRLKTTWRAWLDARRGEAYSTETGRQATADLAGLLFNLSNLYPKGTLLDRDPATPDEHPIVLGRTALGTMNEQQP